jgi:uncharacterized oxidoreductase
MDLSHSTVLITGGASGIGFALARELVEADCRVIICGRRKEKLEKARREIPELITIECDVSSEAGRLSLFSRVTKKFPRFNVLINNATIQQQPAPLTEQQDWTQHRLELATNLDAPLHLSMLFIPHLLKQMSAAIINISSELAFAPLSLTPTYCASKAGLHSFTVSMREQLKATKINVIEVIPTHKNVEPDLFAKHILSQIEAKNTSVAF